MTALASSYCTWHIGQCQINMIFDFAGLVLLAAFQLFAMSFTYPWHAQCTIHWSIDDSCSSVQTKLENQINLWTNNECPSISDSCPKMPCGQKCKYRLTESTEDGIIKATHKTPVKEYVDYLTLNLTSNNKNECQISGHSTSGTWYAVLDFGTNYCNLRNLIDGAGLDKEEGFQEFTANDVCTQYDSRDCTRF